MLLLVDCSLKNSNTTLTTIILSNTTSLVTIPMFEDELMSETIVF